MTANTSVAKRGRDRHDDSLDAYVATAGCKAASMKMNFGELLLRGLGREPKQCARETACWIAVRLETRSSPRRSQLEPRLIERGTLQLKRLHRRSVIALFPWNGSSGPEQKHSAAPAEHRDPLKLAQYYQSLLDSGQFENRAALSRYLGVSRARVTQVLKRLHTNPSGGEPE